jgi:hypothetical protein
MYLYAITILVSAFLLFQVQPIIAKIILPWFGGSAAVWTVCLLFFQVVLLMGYLYAHWLHRHFRTRMQVVIHVLLLLASLAVLPAIPGAGWKPNGGEDPTLRILGLLAATVGLPYFLLSTTGPLVQSWYARRYKDAMPYRLYALSNAGSMFALLSYPVLFEPVFTTRRQAMGWSVGYAVFVLACGVTALTLRSLPEQQVRGARSAGERPAGRRYALWIALPACASILLLAVTNHLSQNVAAIPFLWVLPLSLYLLSFILCFEGSGWYRRSPYLQLFAVAVGGMGYALSEDFENAGIKALIPLFACGLFVCCMVCHGELVRLKPHPSYLTSFYLMISLGGAVGGVFVGLLAPHLFSGYFELPVGLALAAMTVLLALHLDPDSGFHGGWRRPVSLVPALLTLGLIVYMGSEVRKDTRGARVLVRNFYGGLKVNDTAPANEEGAVRKLTHGTIDHGEQFLDPKRRDQPTTYYGPNTGVGLTIRALKAEGPLRVGVIGLGTGTIATYGRPGDYYRYYEINPLVVRLANTEFTFLKDCQAKLDLALGDARLSLEREAPENFDVLAVDAFSSDSIPVHLLTEEAFALYFRHVQGRGVVAVHVSNKYLDLEPVVKLAADALGKDARVVDTQDEDYNEVFGATWMLVTGRRDFFNLPLIKAAAAPPRLAKGLRLWTDDYSNLFKILK